MNRLHTAIASFLASVAILSISATSSAQVFQISSEMLNLSSTIKLSVKDSASKVPIPYASVFLVPEKDSIITSFTMTDTLGRATLSNVTRGSYLLNIELMGFRPVQKEIYVRESQDLGNFFLAKQKQLLKGAEVTAYANPITSVKDTLTYNAAAFGATESEMLVDLVRRLPGMDVDSNGDVKVNGQTINEITVEGRKFFFDDKKTALNNLPAKIVDKIRVIDKESERAEVTGVADDKKRKVMDLELKEEFKKGFFGNAAIKGGTTVGDSQNDDALRDNRPVLYNTNVLAAMYGEKSQLTLVANANNVEDQDANVTVMVVSSDGDIPTLPGGINGNAQLGANLNTSIGKYTLDGTVNLNSSRRDAASHSLRTSGMTTSADMLTETISSTTERNDALKVKFNLKNSSKSAISLNFKPEFTLGGGTTDYNSVSDISERGDITTSSSVVRSMEFGNWTAGGSLTAGKKNLGKTGRNLTLETNLKLTENQSAENSQSDYSDADKVGLIYDGEKSTRSISGRLTYVEPLSKSFTLQTVASADYADGNNSRSATDMGGNSAIGALYSSVQNTTDAQGAANVSIKWTRGKDYVTLGTEAAYSKKMTQATARGITSVSGDEWLFTLSPSVTVRKELANDYSGYLKYSGSLRNPARSSMIPVLDISNATSITAGNIFLKRPYEHRINFNISKYGVSPISVSCNAGITQNAVVSASWYGSDKIRYAIPVNSQDPRYYITANFNMSQKLDKAGKFNFNISFNPYITTATSYQARSVMEGLDLAEFDYAAFMNRFWGCDATGANFYSGKSGFSKSRTFTLSGSGQVLLGYRTKALYTTIRYSTVNSSSRYSLNPSANSNTWNHTIGSYLQYKFPANYTLTSNAKYKFYQGYREGFNDPELSWDLKLEKSIKAFTMILSAHDIFNSTRSTSHNSAEDWYEDTTSLVLGRNIMLGIKWNFGKGNSKNMARATNASMSMML